MVSYTVEQRSREIGVRMALGAKRSAVVGMIVIGQGAKPAIAGVLIGIAVSAGLTRILTNQLYGVTSSDPMTFGLASVILVGATLLASFIPARHASKIDPAVTLRCE